MAKYFLFLMSFLCCAIKYAHAADQKETATFLSSYNAYKIFFENQLTKTNKILEKQSTKLEHHRYQSVKTQHYLLSHHYNEEPVFLKNDLIKRHIKTRLVKTYQDITAHHYRLYKNLHQQTLDKQNKASQNAKILALLRYDANQNTRHQEFDSFHAILTELPTIEADKNNPLKTSKKINFKPPVSGVLQEHNDDFSVFKTRPGSIVYAPDSGKVAFVGKLQGRGYVLALDHENGFQTILQNIGKSFVNHGEVIQQSDPLGVIGSNITHSSKNGAVLSVMLRYNKESVDLKSFITMDE